MVREEQQDMKLAQEQEPRERDFVAEQEPLKESVDEVVPSNDQTDVEESSGSPQSHTTDQDQVSSQTASPHTVSEEVKEVEQILEEDLEDVYVTMDPETQKKFKVEGEQTAQEIVGLLHQVRIKSTKIIKLIAGWLKIVPGLDSFFVEQEAKIKTDKILDSNHKQK